MRAFVLYQHNGPEGEQRKIMDVFKIGILNEEPKYDNHLCWTEL